jgi:osmotically-inducible protein OsmY
MALRRAGWTLVAAGTLGIAWPVSAQSAASDKPFFPTRSRQTAPAPRTPPAPRTGDLDERATEIRVELALMADYMTFPCQLEARLRQGKLVVSGFVPNGVVRQRAVDIAQKISHFPVKEALETREHLPTRSVGVVTQQLPDDVRSVLRDHFPDLAANFKVKAKGNGLVILTGSVPTEEDKLAVSQCLRKVPACTGVLNQLVVETFSFPQTLTKPAARKPWARWLGRSKEMAPLMIQPDDRVEISAPVQPAPAVPGRKPKVEKALFASARSEDTPAAVPAEAEPSGVKRAGFEKADEEPVRWSPNPEILPASPYAANKENPVSPSAGNNTPQEVASRWPASEMQPEAPAFREAKPTSQTFPDTDGYREGNEFRPAGNNPLSSPALRASTWSQPPEERGNTLIETAPEPAKREGFLKRLFHRKPRAEQIAVEVAEAAPPEKLPQVVARTNPLPQGLTLPGKPYEANGLVVFTDEPAPAAPLSGAAAKTLKAKMTRSILEAYGRRVRDVEVVPRSLNSVLVRFKVPSQAEGEDLSPRILALPEFDAYQVDLEVKVSP